MRKFKKYNLYSKIIINSFFLRILKFKRMKWKKSQLRLIKKKSWIFLFNFKNLLTKIKIWGRVKKSFKNSLYQKNYLRCRFDSNIKLSKNLIFTLLKYQLKIDILLWFLGFFFSIYETKKNIFLGNILVNSKICFNTKKLLKRGDIITFKQINFKINLNRKTKEIFSSFLEIDYYTKTIVIVEDFFNFKFLDLTLSTQENLRMLN